MGILGKVAAWRDWATKQMGQVVQSLSEQWLRTSFITPQDISQGRWFEK